MEASMHALSPDLDKQGSSPSPVQVLSKEILVVPRRYSETRPSVGKEVLAFTLPGDPSRAVSGDGRVFSLRNNKRGWVELVPHMHHGYKRVTFRRNGEAKNYRVHLLVLEVFHGPKPFPEAVGRHLDGNKLNNGFMNLAWGTEEDNIRDSIRHGQLKTRLTQADASAIRRSPLSSWDLAKKFGCSAKTIVDIRNYRKMLPTYYAPVAGGQQLELED